VAFLSDGQLDQALAEAKREMLEWARLCALAAVHHATGNRAESEAALERLKATSPQDCAYQIAIVHAFRGEADEAFAWFERAWAQRDSGMVFLPSHLDTHVMLAPIKNDPRWPEFMKRIPLPTD
jgi:hypothetical protein